MMTKPVIPPLSALSSSTSAVHATLMAGDPLLPMTADNLSAGHSFTETRIPAIPCLDPKLKSDRFQPTAAYRGRVKYNEEAARKYQLQKLSKHRAEMGLIDRAFALIPKSHRVLDVPCGGGRVSLHLSSKGYAMSLGDLSEAMLAIARENVAGAGLECPVDRQDIEALSCGDRAFDTIVCFRLFHHFPNPKIRRRTVLELCRAAGQFVVMSYCSTMSITALRRKLRTTLAGKKSGKYATSLDEVRGYFEQGGFELVKDFAEMPIIHTLHLAVFRRVQ